MQADSAVVEEWPVWLEVNGEPAVTWMGGRTAGHRCRKVSVETVLTRTQAEVPAKTYSILDCAKSSRSARELGNPRMIIA